MGEESQHQDFGESAWLEKLEQTLDLPTKLRQILAQAKLIKVVVNKEKRRWRIYVEFNQLISQHELNSLADLIGRSLAVSVSFAVTYRLNHLSLSRLCERWDLLIEAVSQRFPVVYSWASAIRPDVRGNVLRLGLDNPMGIRYLQQKEFPSRLGWWLSEILGNLVSVELFEMERQVVDTQQLKQHYLSQVEVSVPQPATGNNGNHSDKNSKRKRQSGPRVIKGKHIDSGREIISLKKIKDEEKEIIVLGKIFSLEIRDLKSERRLITFDLTDDTDSITVKTFAKKNEDWVKKLKEGLWLKIRGSVQHDRYTQELTLFCQDINLSEPAIREDKAEKKRVELHLHTKMSALDAVVDVPAAVATAARWGHPAIAITDHGVVQAFPEAFAAGGKYGVKIIYGLEGYLVEDNWQEDKNYRSYHIILLVENIEGLENLYKIVSQSHLQHFYRKPLLPRSILNEYRQGLLLGTACESGELIQAYLHGAAKDELARIAQWYDYIEIQPKGNNLFLVRQGKLPSEEDLQKMNVFLANLGRQLGKPVVAACDVHFLEPADSVYREILMSGQGYDDVEQPPLYFYTTEEMLREFAYLGEDLARQVVIEAPRMIAERVEGIRPIPETLHPPEIPGADQEIIEMATGNAERLYGSPLPEVVKSRLEKELHAIISNDFAVLYLIAHKLVKKSNQDGYLVGSRGSVGSSFVATMTGITEVNPLPPHYLCRQCGYSEFINDGSVNSGVDLPDKQCPHCNQLLKKDGHDIPFEVFLGFKGDKVPDIDLNFSGDYQPRAHRFTEELFGRDHVFRAGTIATIAERTAFGFVKNYFQDRKKVARTAEINRLVRGIAGVKRTTGQHPGGLMVVPRQLDIHMFSPIQHPADDTASEVITTHFDYHAISSRLVKLDILGHDDPTVIKMLEDLTGVDAKSIPLDEPKTMSLFSSVAALGVTPEDIGSEVGTYGIPEFGTRFVRQMLVDTKPRKFSDLVRISGLSHGTDVWLNNAQELIRGGTATISEVISTRDDIMVFLIYKGMPKDLSFKIMEDVRKGRGLKPEYAEKMKECHVPQWYIDSCNKIKYMFPKAHAVAYVTMAYRIAYFKAYYPEAFYATFFTVRADQFDAQLIANGRNVVKKQIKELETNGNNLSQKEKNLLTILEVALEMYCRGIQLLPVDLEKSDAQQFLITPEGILAPFASLQGVGEQVAMNIVKAREERLFSSQEDLKSRGRVSSAVMDILMQHGTLDHLPVSDQMALF